MTAPASLTKFDKFVLMLSPYTVGKAVENFLHLVSFAVAVLFVNWISDGFMGFWGMIWMAFVWFVMDLILTSLQARARRRKGPERGFIA